jgi:cytochrome o ubiquinol oxidase subunit 2
MRFKLRGVSDAEFGQWVAGARGSGKALDLPAYMQLVKPSERVPVMHFAAVGSDLYRRILERCVEPGKPCMSDVMAHDRQAGSGNPHEMRPGAGMPQGRDSAPLHGQKPEGAIFKSPEERGSGPNVTKPAHPDKAPGVTKPGDPANRDIGAVAPIVLPLAQPAANV